MKKKQRREYRKTRRNRKRGILCNCYYCLSKIERKRANALRPYKRKEIPLEEKETP